MSAKGYNHLDIHLYTHPFIIPSFHKAMGEFWSNPLGWLVTFVFSINESIYTILLVKYTLHMINTDNLYIYIYDNTHIYIYYIIYIYIYIT